MVEMRKYASLHYQSEKNTELSLIMSPNVSFPSEQHRALMVTEEEADNREQLLESFVLDEKCIRALLMTIKEAQCTSTRFVKTGSKT